MKSTFSKCRFTINFLLCCRLITFHCGVKSEKYLRMREKISAHATQSYQNRLLSLDDQVRKLDAQRIIRGWNLSKFFVFKECLAFTYYIFHQYDQALLLYEELASLISSGHEDHFFLTFFPDKVPSTTTAGSSIFPFQSLKFPFLNPFEISALHQDSSVRYFLDLRSQLIENKLSFFECRLYLLYRQIDLLLELGNIQDAYSKVSVFLCEISPLFSANQEILLSEYRDNREHQESLQWLCWRYHLIDTILQEIHHRSIKSPHLLDFSFLKTLYVSIKIFGLKIF